MNIVSRVPTSEGKGELASLFVCLSEHELAHIEGMGQYAIDGRRADQPGTDFLLQAAQSEEEVRYVIGDVHVRAVGRAASDEARLVGNNMNGDMWVTPFVPASCDVLHVVMFSPQGLGHLRRGYVLSYRVRQVRDSDLSRLMAAGVYSRAAIDKVLGSGGVTGGGMVEFAAAKSRKESQSLAREYAERPYMPAGRRPITPKMLSKVRMFGCLPPEKPQHTVSVYEVVSPPPWLDRWTHTPPVAGGVGGPAAGQQGTCSE